MSKYHVTLEYCLNVAGITHPAEFWITLKAAKAATPPTEKYPYHADEGPAVEHSAYVGSPQSIEATRQLLHPKHYILGEQPKQDDLQAKEDDWGLRQLIKSIHNEPKDPLEEEKILRAWEDLWKLDGPQLIAEAEALYFPIRYLEGPSEDKVWNLPVVEQSASAEYQEIMRQVLEKFPTASNITITKEK